MSLQTNLFNPNHEIVSNKISLDNGEIIYLPSFFDKTESDRLFSILLDTIEWKQDVINMYGKLLPLPRLSAWYGETSKPYSYSGITLHPLPWTKELMLIKDRIENETKVFFTSVLLNRYRDGSDYVGWHADDEKELGENPIIGSVNFGATRKFQMRRIDNHKKKIEIELKHGTFLSMQGSTQHFWQHQIPKTAYNVGERINLTFRTIY